MASNVLNLLLKCLILTVVFESVFAFIIGVRNKKDILNVILVNIVTNPLVNTISFYMNINHGILARRISLLILEISAVIFEGYIYKKYFNYKKINPYLISIILNLVSYGLGIIINGF